MLLATPDIILTAAVTILAALICLWTAILVARTRGKHKVSPPAMTGSFAVECALRVQGNTVEQIVIFLPLLWVAALYFHSHRLAGAADRAVLVHRPHSSSPPAIWPSRRSAAPALRISVFSSIALAILGVTWAWCRPGWR